MTSDGIPAQAPRVSWAHWTLLAAIAGLVIAIYARGANSAGAELRGPNPADSYYNLLVRGFQAGQLNLKRETPPEFAQLDGPYDPKANATQLQQLRDLDWIIPRHLHDLSFYRGKLYLYFGATPALLLFWPYATLTGHYLLHKHAVVFFFSLGYLSSVGLLLAAWRRYFARVSPPFVAAGMLALGLADFTPAILRRADVYEVAISCGYAMVMLALVGIWMSLHRPGQRGRWLAAASLAYGLALGARPSLLPGAAMLMVPVIMAWRKTDPSDQSDPSPLRANTGLQSGDPSQTSMETVSTVSSTQDSLAATAPSATAARRPSWQLLSAALGPITLIGMGLLLYNYLRFDDPFGFGQRYQLPVSAHQQFSLRFLWFNSWVGLLAPARWIAHTPFIQDIAVVPAPKGYSAIEDHAFGILSNIPLTWLALAAALACLGPKTSARPNLRAFLIATCILLAGTAGPILLHDSISIRYEFEVTHPLLLLAAIGGLALERSMAHRPPWRWIMRSTCASLLLLSLGFNLVLSRALQADADCYLATARLEQGRPDDAILRYQQALDINPEAADVQDALGGLLFQRRRLDDAIAHFRKAVEIQPDFAQARYDLGNSLYRKGLSKEAIVQCQKAVDLGPTNLLFQADLAWILATSPDGSVRDGARALQLARRANQLSGGQSATVLGALAAAYAERGQFAEAVDAAGRGLDLATAQNDPPLAQSLSAHIRLYKAGLPYREPSAASSTPPKP